MAKNDAGEYVDAVMSSQLLTRIGTPVDNRGKKRTRSEPCVIDSGVKKQRVAKAKKSLYTGKQGEKQDENNESSSENPSDIRNTSIENSEDSDASDNESNGAGIANSGTSDETVSDDEDLTTGAEVDVEVINVEEGSGKGISTSTTIVETLLANLAADINLQFSAINERMDRLEAGLEKRITQKLTQVIDKRVSSELSKIRKNVDDQVQNVKADIASEFRSDFDQVNDKIEEVADKVSNHRESDNLALNIAIRELPEHSNENVLDKVNKLIKDGLKVADVVCERAERKGNAPQSNKPRVIIAHFKSFEDKRKVMTKKNTLKNSTQYRNVYIHHDQPLSERVMADNLRAVLNALRHAGLTMRGSRVIQMGRGDSQRANGSNYRQNRWSNRQEGTDRERHGHSPRASGSRDAQRGSPDGGRSRNEGSGSHDNPRRDSHRESSGVNVNQSDDSSRDNFHDRVSSSQDTYGRRSGYASGRGRGGRGGRNQRGQNNRGNFNQRDF